ncbi:MAG: phosphatase PAP2 family protein [Cocleimonas sp.]|nr:phosphatase PAP2 family protein [Cocleimonas sp.]
MLKKSPIFIISTLFTVALSIFFLNANLQLFILTNKLGSAFTNETWVMISVLGHQFVTLILVLIIFRRHPDLLRAALLAALLSFLVVGGIKLLIALDRPYDVLDPASFYLISEKLTTYAFPSGHTAAAFSTLGCVGFYFRNNMLLLFAFFFASLIGLSRIMLGVHWPIDIFVGAALGWVFAWLSVAVIRAKFLRDSNIWNYVTYSIYLSIAAYLFWNVNQHGDALWLVLIISILGIFVALRSFIWLFKGGNKDPVSVTGWLS